jgi:nucleoside-diphosphate-sugar epimerase
VALLITGAMGHVGNELVRQAAARGHSVVAQYRSTFREADARAVSGDVTWARCDLADPYELAALVLRYPIEGCIHTAAVPNDQVARPDPMAAIRANAGAVAALLDVARLRSWRRFLYVSTGSVFQNATDPSRPILEDAQPIVTNVYSTTKHCGELLTAMYRSQYGLSAATVRISWVYGPPLVPRRRDNPRGPIPVYLKAALRGEPLSEASGGDFAASFTYVEDVAAGLLAAYAAPALNHDVYHLGLGVNFTAREVAEAVRAAVPGAVIEVGPGTAPWTDHTRMRGPLAGERLQLDAGFVPRYDVAAGIAAFAAWMRANPDSYR